MKWLDTLLENDFIELNPKPVGYQSHGSLIRMLFTMTLKFPCEFPRNLDLKKPAASRNLKFEQ